MLVDSYRDLFRAYAKRGGMISKISMPRENITRQDITATVIQERVSYYKKVSKYLHEE